MKVSNFRPVSALKFFSTIHKSVIKNLLTSVLKNVFSPYITAYRVFMDLSRAFNCISHVSLSAKLSAYGFNGNILKYIYSILKIHKHCVCINSISSDFKDIIFWRLAGLSNCTNFT